MWEKGEGTNDRKERRVCCQKLRNLWLFVKCEFGIYVISRMYDNFNQQVNLRHLEGEGKEGGRGRGEKMGEDGEIKNLTKRS